MNTPIPKITKEQAEIAFTGAVVPLELLNIYNERIDAANAQQETYITADKHATLRAEYAKQVSWTGSREDVIALLKELEVLK